MKSREDIKGCGGVEAKWAGDGRWSGNLLILIIPNVIYLEPYL